VLSDVNSVAMETPGRIDAIDDWVRSICELDVDTFESDRWAESAESRFEADMTRWRSIARGRPSYQAVSGRSQPFGRWSIRRPGKRYRTILTGHGGKGRSSGMRHGRDREDKRP
jgi:hypothetical protein